MCCMFEIEMEPCTQFELAFDNRNTIMRNTMGFSCVVL